MVTKKRPQHDRKHENGLAAPGKRIARQRSIPQLNSNVNVNQSSHPPTPPLPASHLAQPPQDPAVSFHGQRQRAPSDASLDTSDNCRSYDIRTASYDPTADATPRRADSNPENMASLPISTVLTVPATILTSCPLRDVLAILILLLQLPPTVLTIVQFLFATLTFVPPQAGTPLSALSAFPSFTDIFQGSGGTPSLFTTIFADALILVLWLLLWVPVQNFFLDLAQAVIAIALGGAAAGKSGTTNGIFICIVIVLANHLLRLRPLRQHLMHLLWAGLARGGLQFLASPPSMPTSLESLSAPHGWPRSLLGIHILAQGVVRMIRRYLSRRDASPSLPTGKKVDPEAGGLQRAGSASLDPNAEAPNISTGDGRPPGPSPASHAHKDRTSSSRRKRKQATHVRSQQPFWAALASTKVTVLKEMESSRATNDADEANAKDTNHIGNAMWSLVDDRVWISEVGASEVSFRANFSSTIDAQDQSMGENSAKSGVDKSKPFYVRVNGADWSSTRIRQGISLGHEGQEGIRCWVGEIFGLTSLSNYYCEFVRTISNEVLYSVSLITSASPVTEQASIISSPAHQSLRPSSPTTTLRSSIASADQQLQDQRNRLKRVKKDHKTAISTLKKEVDTLANRLGNAGGTDERQRQRALQFTSNIRLAEDAAAEFIVQADRLGAIPEDETNEAATKRAEWKKQRDNKRVLSEKFDNDKARVERQIQSIENDVSTALQKRDRLIQRQTRLNEQYDRLIIANQEGFTAKQRREQERVALRQRRADMENQYRNSIMSYERKTEEQNVTIAHMMQAVQHYESALLQQQSYQNISAPTTPEGPLPGTNMSPPANAFAIHTFPSLNSRLAGTPDSARGGRNRSSSMFSNVSGFTDGYEDFNYPSTYILGNLFSAPGMLKSGGGNGSHGSGSLSSGTSSQSSIQGDAMSPIQNHKPMMVRSGTGSSAGLMSPIGTGR